MNYSGKTKPCSKGCGAEIYWDEEFKSDSGKFIPIDSRTDEPHQCEGPTESPNYYPDEIKKFTKKKDTTKRQFPFQKKFYMMYQKFQNR